jgi:HPt (histidine-containing phosphotransfer) domain-containing protein
LTENYFNYFTEIEDHFQRARGTGLFLLSPLDWALIEAWKNAGIPLEAVLRGIDQAFDKWRSRPPRGRIQMVNSLAYCAQAIAAEVQAMVDGRPAKSSRAAPPFSLEDVRAYIAGNAATLRKTGLEELAASLEGLPIDALYGDLEQLEQRLTAIEEKMIARLRSDAPDEALFEARRTLDRELKPYRGKMSVDQLAMLEKQFLERKLLESNGLPRLSLFYLHS